MNPWECDEHGTQVLRLDILGGGYLWIQGRRPYCDRGHWEWGFEGLHQRNIDLPAPSYYYMRKERLMEELETWLSRLCGAALKDETFPAQTSAFSQGHGAQPGWEWTPHTDGTLTAFIGQPGKPTVKALIERVEGRSGTHFVFTLPEGDLNLDHSDRFPRVYMRLETAMAEAEELLGWRLLKLPAEIPHPLSEPARPVGELLKLSTGTIKTSKPRHSP